MVCSPDVEGGGARLVWLFIDCSAMGRVCGHRRHMQTWQKSCTWCRKGKLPYSMHATPDCCTIYALLAIEEGIEPQLNLMVLRSQCLLCMCVVHCAAEWPCKRIKVE